MLIASWNAWRVRLFLDASAEAAIAVARNTTAYADARHKVHMRWKRTKRTENPKTLVALDLMRGSCY